MTIDLKFFDRADKETRPSDIIVFSYTPEGGTLYMLAKASGMNHSQAMETLSEGVHYSKHIIDYKAMVAAPPLLRTDNTVKYKGSRAKKIANLALLAFLPYLSPNMEQAKHNAEKYLTCREYRVEIINDKETLMGIECKLKENRLDKPLTYRI